MHEMTLRWEDPQQLRAVLGHLYDILESDRPTALNKEGLAVYTSEELADELRRRSPPPDGMNSPAPAVETEKPKRTRAKKEADPPAAANEPQADGTGDPEPDPAAIPKTEDVAPPAGDPITTNVPERSEMESLLSSLYALTSMEYMREVIQANTGQPTLSKAPQDTWAKLKVALVKGIEEHKAKAAA